jgi:hypothetical protein
LHNQNAIVDRAGRWFLNSGIQEDSGGVARYYQSDTGKNARVSTEITGYGVSTFVYLWRRLGDPVYLQAAIRSARFLCRTAWNPSLQIFPFEYSANGNAPQPLAYFFDSGIIVRGLIALWRTTGEAEFLQAATFAGESMARDFKHENTLHPIIELPAKQALPHTIQWSRSPGCYQLKSALGWHDLHEETGDARFLKWYESAAANAVAARESFLPDPESEHKTVDRLHAYAYFLEGLLPLAAQPEYDSVLADGIERIGRYLRSLAPSFERSDVYAQLLRIRLLANRLAGVPIQEEEAAEEAAAMPLFQMDHADPRLNGGFAFGRKHGEVLPFINPVSTAFCLQAIVMWQDHQEGKTPDRHSLI